MDIIGKALPSEFRHRMTRSYLCNKYLPLNISSSYRITDNSFQFQMFTWVDQLRERGKPQWVVKGFVHFS